jgi:protoporphyrinogen oxidase
MTLILGAGLAGLSAATHLDGRDRLVVERAPEVGGLCRSIREQGFTFDYTGHLLHLRDPETAAWIRGLLPDGFVELNRSAWIHSHGTLTPYPFQANTAGLPIDVRMECLLGFIETLRHPDRRRLSVPDAKPVPGGPPFLRIAPPPTADEPTFQDWILDVFGAGFAKHFFVPYNTKLWRRKLDEVTGDWVSWSIPRPELGDVLRGAITTTDKAFGYNPEFLYPRDGGIDHLPRAMAAHLPPDIIRLGTAAVELDAGSGAVRLDDGTTVTADSVLTSIPLPQLVALTTDLPADLVEAAGRLRHISVRAVNLGVRGEPIHAEPQWVYFPEPDVPFYRLGQPTALTPAMAPQGHHSFILEQAFRPDEDDEGPEASQQAAIDGLLRKGFLRSADDVVHARVIDIPEAYVVFNRDRREVLPALMRWYVERGVIPMGRYGAWDYLSMEDSLRHGRQAAAWVSGRVH